MAPPMPMVPQPSARNRDPAAPARLMCRKSCGCMKSLIGVTVAPALAARKKQGASKTVRNHAGMHDFLCGLLILMVVAFWLGGGFGKR